ncbi:hypothetical protein BX600DRAFT_476815 [Xylariales sp. PMI_506]|nr:hypothetical protein BX600DRAFT_476815 [Xylariales sp. PMI_506]
MGYSLVLVMIPVVLLLLLPLSMVALVLLSVLPPIVVVLEAEMTLVAKVVGKTLWQPRLVDEDEDDEDDSL